MANFKDLMIIFDEDAEPWADSFVNNFVNFDVNCYKCNVKSLIPITNKNVRDQLKASKAILVILSEQFVDYLVKNKGLHLKDSIPDPEIGILLYLNVTEHDIRYHNLDERFTDFENPLWIKRSYDENSTGEDFQECLLAIHELVSKRKALSDTEDVVTKQVADRNGSQPTKDQKPEARSRPTKNSGYIPMDKTTTTATVLICDQEYTTTDNPPVLPAQDEYDDVPDDQTDRDNYDIQSKKKRPYAKKQLKVTAVPDVVQCEAGTEVALCFKEALEGFEAGSMDLVLEKKDDCNDTYELKEVEQINPYTYKFKLNSDHTEKKVNILVYWKDECVALCPLEFRSYTHVIDGVSNILLQVLDETCTLLKKTDPTALQKLDSQLKRNFLNETTTIRPDAFENLFGMYEFIDEDVRSQEEIPTLVHLAAKYGLKEMSAKLMDLPSACKACSITNMEQKQPAELAEKHENFELASFFRNISDLGEDLYGMYVKMQNYDPGYLHPKSRKYYNTGCRDPATALYYIYNTRTPGPQVPKVRGQPAGSQQVYDVAELLPTEDYMDMKGFKRTLNPPPARATGSPGLPTARQKPAAPPPELCGGEIYDDADQESQSPRFPASQTAAEKDAAAKGGLASQDMSPEQMALVNIGKKVTEEELSIEEARNLYFDWKRVNDRMPHDFKSRCQQMQNVQTLLEKRNAGSSSKPPANAKGQDKKAKGLPKHSSKTTIYVKSSQIKKPPVSPKPKIKTEEVYDDVDSDPEEHKPIVPAKNFRNSSGSNGSRDSQNSSGDSGLSFETDEKGGTMKHGDKVQIRTTPRKKSVSSKLRNSFSSTPPVPPKLPPRGTHLRPRYEKPPPETPTSPTKPPARRF